MVAVEFWIFYILVTLLHWHSIVISYVCEVLPLWTKALMVILVLRLSEPA